MPALLDSPKSLLEQEIYAALQLPGPEAVHRLTDLLKSQRKSRRPHRAPLFAAFCIAAFLLLCGLFLPPVGGGTLFLLGGALSALVAASSMIVMGALKNEAETACPILAAFSRIEDTAAIAPLLDLQSSISSEQNEAAHTAILLLMNCLAEQETSPDAALLERLHVLLLAYPNEMAYAADEELRTALFRVMARFGDKRAMMPAYFTMFMEAATRQEIALRDAAKRAFAAINARTDYGSVTDLSHLLANSLIPPAYGLDANILFRRQALIHLLPQVNAQNAALISREHREALYSQLQNVYSSSPFFAINVVSAELILEIIALAGRLEDTKALPAIRRFAHTEAPTAGERRIREAAREVLPRLQARAEREETGKTLLRASDAPVHPDTLLRPAMPAASQDEPQQLLRASDSTGQ